VLSAQGLLFGAASEGSKLQKARSIDPLASVVWLGVGFPVERS